MAKESQCKCEDGTTGSCVTNWSLYNTDCCNRFCDPDHKTKQYSNMSGMGSNGSMSVGAYAISMLSVGVLFFVIGYGYYKGKESA